jgi:hypothetical protein
MLSPQEWLKAYNLKYKNSTLKDISFKNEYKTPTQSLTTNVTKVETKEVVDIPNV